MVNHNRFYLLSCGRFKIAQGRGKDRVQSAMPHDHSTTLRVGSRSTFEPRIPVVSRFDSDNACATYVAALTTLSMASRSAVVPWLRERGVVTEGVQEAVNLEATCVNDCSTWDNTAIDLNAKVQSSTCPGRTCHRRPYSSHMRPEGKV